MITDGNILKPSEVNPPGGGGGGTPLPVYFDLGTTEISNVKIRVLNFNGISDAHIAYITDTGLAGGNALFTNILFAQISVINALYGSIMDQYTCSVEIISNITIKIGLLNLISGIAPGDVSVILIGN